MDDVRRLITKIQKHRSRKAADLLVRKYYREIYVYVYRQIGNREDAMDLTQDIFISMLQSIRYYEYQKSTFRTWLYRIATNKIIDFRRTYRPVSLSLEEIEVQEPKDYIRQFQQSELLQRIEEFISAYDASAQMIFRLHIYDDQTFSQIADMMSLPEATVKSKYYRLQKKIKEEFQYDEN